VRTRASGDSRLRVSVALRMGTLLVMTANCGAALAQEAASKQQAATKSDQPAAAVDAPEVPEIIVTAQRREQRLSDVPMSVTAQTGEALRQAGVSSTSMLEQVSPAISFTQTFSATASSLTMRGVQSFARAGGVQPSVGVVIDDMPVSRQFEAVIEFADIERIEILSGPQGTLFGKNATAGVVNIVTNRPRHELGASLEFEQTTDHETIGKGILNVPLTDSVAARLNSYYYNLDPLVKNLAGPDEYARRAYGVSGKLLFDLSDRTNLLLTAQYNHFSSSTGVFLVINPISGPNGVAQRRLLGPAVGYGVDIVNQNSPSFDVAFSESYIAELKSEITDKLRLVSISGFRRFKDRNGIDADAVNVGDTPPGQGFVPNPLNYFNEAVSEPDQQFQPYKYWSQEVRLNYSTRLLDIVAGAYYQDYDESRYLRGTARNTAASGLKYINDTVRTSVITDKTFAAFGDATLEIAPTIKTFGGLRYTREQMRHDYVKTAYHGLDNGVTFNPFTAVLTLPPTLPPGDTFTTVAFSNLRRADSNISGRVGIQWQPTPTLNYYASYNTGFKAAGVNTGGDVSLSRAYVSPETARAFELGAKQRFFEGKLAIDVALYKQKVNDIQQSAVLPGGGIQTTLLNAGDLKTDGFDVNITARPTAGLTLNTGVVYNDARYSGSFRFTCGPVSMPGACAPVGTILNGVPIGGTIALDGTQAIGTPEWKVVTSGVYEHKLGAGLQLTTRVAYNWRSSIYYTLDHDPVNGREPGYGILDASIALGSADGRWQVTMYGKNLADTFYYVFRGVVPGSLANSYGILPRDYRRYGGIRLSYAF
jgi:iron complex outermembrane receptor protein